MEKQILTAQEAKKRFMVSVYNMICDTLRRGKHEDVVSNFRLQDSSIMVDIPADFFLGYDVPENTKIEIKFIAKKA